MFKWTKLRSNSLCIRYAHFSKGRFHSALPLNTALYGQIVSNMSKNLKKISKYLSYLLRHEPESIGLKLDSHGWALVDDLLSLTDIERDVLEEVVFTNEKQRFAFSADGRSIRANQGHSINGLDLGLEVQTPPEVLYHGTVEKFIESIRKHGLQKIDRNHVHLSATTDTAKNVGSRRGKPIILVVNATQMHSDGIKFYLSANGVWLVDAVPYKYIEREIV